MRATGKTLEQVLDDLANRSGLLGLSGMATICATSRSGGRTGDARAQLALDVFVASVRHYLGAYLLLLNGADAIVFTGGIGENSVTHARGRLCRPGLVRHPARPGSAMHGAKGEVPIHAPDSRVQLWIMPTNEELIVARQAKELLVSSQA